MDKKARILKRLESNASVLGMEYAVGIETWA